MNYIQTKLDGHQVDIVKDDYSLRQLISRGWSVVGVLDAGCEAETRLLIARPYDAANAERDATLAASEERCRKAESAAYEAQRKLDSATKSIGELTQRLAEATAALAPRIDAGT